MSPQRRWERLHRCFEEADSGFPRARSIREGLQSVDGRLHCCWDGHHRGLDHGVSHDEGLPCVFHVVHIVFEPAQRLTARDPGRMERGESVIHRDAVDDEGDGRRFEPAQRLIPRDPSRMARSESVIHRDAVDDEGDGRRFEPAQRLIPRDPSRMERSESVIHRDAVDDEGDGRRFEPAQRLDCQGIPAAWGEVNASFTAIRSTMKGMRGALSLVRASIRSFPDALVVERFPRGRARHATLPRTTHMSRFFTLRALSSMN